MVPGCFISTYERYDFPMNVTVETQGPCRKLLKVEYSAEEVQAEYNEWLQVFQNQAEVKGFRPGKAPRDVVQRFYDKHIREQMRDPLIGKGYQQAVKEHHLKDPVAEMDLQQSELKAGQPFSFSMVVDLAPEFELPPYQGLEIEAKKVEVADEAVTKAIERYRENTGEFEEVTEERPIQVNDMVAVDYVATVDRQPMGEFAEKAKELSADMDFWVMVNEEFSFLPGFAAQLVGLKVGDSKAIDVSFDAASAPVEELKGKTAVFQTTVKKIKVRTPRAMDAEFFKSMGVTNEAELRDTFRGLLEGEAHREEIKRRRDELLGKLLKLVQFDLPESQVQEETLQVVYEVVGENSRRGVPEEEIRKQLDQIEKSAAVTAKERLKVRFLFERIAAQEHITVTETEVTKRLSNLAQYSGAKDIAAWLQTMNQKEKDVRQNVRRDILNAKVIEFLMEAATLVGAGAEPVAEETK